MRDQSKAGKIATLVKEQMIRGEEISMPDRLYIATSGTPEAFVLSIQTRDKLGRTLTYFDCPPMRIGDTIDVSGLRKALLKFEIV